MKNFKWFIIVIVAMCFLISLVSIGWSAERLKRDITGVVKKIPLPTCTFKPYLSGLPKPTFNGQYYYGETLKVTSKVIDSGKFTAWGKLTIKVNGVTKEKICSNWLNQFEAKPNSPVDVPLQCGAEKDVTTTEITSATAYIKKIDGTVINCTLDTSVEVIK